MTNQPTRLQPRNLDAEASVIGGVILRNDALLLLPDLETDDFYDPRHKIIWQAIRNLEAAQKPIDVVTVEDEIERQGKLDAMGGIAYLGELTLRVPVVENVVAYARIVQEKSTTRKLILVASELFEKGFEDGLEVDEYLSGAMSSLAKLDRAKPDRTLRVGDMVKRRITEHELAAAAKTRGETVLSGIPSGIAELDAKYGGYPIGDLVILAARPAMGKTAMAMASVDAATLAGFGALVFSNEGGWRMYADRLIARASGIGVQRLRAGDFQLGDSQAIANALLKFHKRTNWMLDDRGGLSANEIIRTARRWKAELGLRLVVVDYVQVIKGNTRGLDENARLDEIVTAFSQAALQDDVTYLVVSQLNRKVEDRTDKRPQLADLRGSGSLEERPRMIVSPYRGSYYYDTPKQGVDFECACIVGAPCSHIPSPKEFEELVQVLVLKNNNGATGCAKAHWKAETTEMS